MVKNWFNNIRSIKLKLWLRLTLWLLPLFFIISFVEKRSAEKLCKGVHIRVEEQAGVHFLDEKDIEQLMSLKGKEFLVGESIKNIDLKELETRIKANPFVDNAQVHKDLQGILSVEVSQCEPMARLLIDGGNDFYISKKGKLLPMSPKFTARVLVLDGPFVGKLIRTRWDTSAVTRPYLDLVQHIVNDEFLNIQVHQVTINAQGEVSLYSQVGNHVIEMGQPDDLDKKFNYIKLFYNEILPSKGWNYYQKVNLKYHNQIICEQ